MLFMKHLKVHSAENTGLHPGAMEAPPGAEKAYSGDLEDHPRALDTYPAAVKHITTCYSHRYVDACNEIFRGLL